MEYSGQIENGLKCSCSWCSMISVILKLKINVTSNDHAHIARFDSCIHKEKKNISPECLKYIYTTSSLIDNKELWEKVMEFFFDSLKYNPACNDIYEMIPLLLIRQNRDKECLSFIKYWLHALTGWINYNQHNAYKLYNSGSWAYGNSALANVNSLSDDILRSVPTNPAAIPLSFFYR